jgi:hypothetical protein
MGVWQGVAMDSLKDHSGPPCLTLLRPVGGPPLRRPSSCFRGDPTARRAACGHLLPFWAPHAIRLWETQGFNMQLKQNEIRQHLFGVFCEEL